ncbi:TIM barrel protein [Methanobacterium sp. ACI-7]|uniref:TIM barrel protein n=1 Tax=unclassified Methanobacterium TaxID=2627676 RepID=UPI0039C06979
MKPEVRFGPAGRPIGYKGKTEYVCDYLKEIGLDAFEYQATYGVKLSKQPGLALAKNALKNDVLISMHGPYYINMCSQKEETIKNSIKRLIQSASAGEWINAYRIVFHMGFYTKYSPEEAMKKCKESIETLLEKVESLGIKNYTFAPETTGKKSQFGSLDELINICQSFDNFAPTVDFAHIHAREGGSIKSKEDYTKIFDKIEDEIGLSVLHSHFTKIEYTDKGERRHHVLADDNYGPPLVPLLELISECDYKVTLICETPLIDIDAVMMKKEFVKI